MIKAPSPTDLQTAFLALQTVLSDTTPHVPRQSCASNNLQTAFKELKRPLMKAKARGGLINPWALAGLHRDEVRNAAALAGLWMPEFGGVASLQFLASYLTTAIPQVNWLLELGVGYRVAKEVCPLGQGADRVDIVIETQQNLIGIEVKIGAGLGPGQLERYSLAIGRRAALQRLRPWIILLAPFRTTLLDIATTSWRDITRAARAVAGEKADERFYVQHLVASFGEYVQDF